MSWNYRIVRYRDGSGFGLHEVFYDDDGEPWGMTEKPIDFACRPEEGAEGIREQVALASLDAQRRPVLEEPEVWPGKAP